MRFHLRNRRPAITALQLVVVLAVLLLLLALLLPAVQRVREAAMRTQSTNNLKQLGLAMHSYHDTFKGFPPGVGEMNNQSGPTHFHVLPFLEQDHIYRKAEGASWRNGTYGVVIPTYVDPRDPTLPNASYKGWLATTNYPVNWLATRDGKMQLQAFPDGTSNTLMFAQRYQLCNGQPTAWGYPAFYQWAPLFAYYSQGMFQVAPTQDRCNPELPQSLSRGILVALCDGSVRHVSENIRPTTWYYLTDPADGNPLPPEAFE